MATFKIKRGPNANVAGVTPAEGEPIYVTDTKTLRIGDGVTAGGANVQVASANVVTNNAQPNITSVGTLTSLAVTGNANAATFNGNLNGTTATLTGSISGANITSTGFGARFIGSGAGLTVVPAGNLSGTIPSTVLDNSNMFIGTTSVSLARASGALTLNNVSVTGSASTVTNGSQGNIISVGNLIGLTVNGNITNNGNITGGNLQYNNANILTSFTSVNANITGNVNANNVAVTNTVTANAITSPAGVDLRITDNGNIIIQGNVSERDQGIVTNNNVMLVADAAGNALVGYEPSTHGLLSTNAFNAGYGVGVIRSGLQATTYRPRLLLLDHTENTYVDDTLPEQKERTGGGIVLGMANGNITTAGGTSSDRYVRADWGLGQITWSAMNIGQAAPSGLNPAVSISAKADSNWDSTANVSASMYLQYTPNGVGGRGQPRTFLRARQQETTVSGGDKILFKPLANYDTGVDLRTQLNAIQDQTWVQVSYYSGGDAATEGSGSLLQVRDTRTDGPVALGINRTVGSNQAGYQLRLNSGSANLELRDAVANSTIVGFNNSNGVIVNQLTAGSAGNITVNGDVVANNNVLVTGNVMRMESAGTGDVRLGIKRTGGTASDYDWLLRNGEDRITLFDRANTTDIFSANVSGAQFNVPGTVTVNGTQMALRTPGSAPVNFVLQRGIGAEFKLRVDADSGYSRLRFDEDSVEIAEFSLTEGPKFLNSYLTVDETSAVKDARIVLKRSGGTAQAYQLNIKQGETQLTLVDQTANVEIAEFANGSVKFYGTGNISGNLDVGGNINLTGRVLGYDRVYGEFYHDTAITPAAADTIYAFPLNSTTANSDVSISNTSRINISKPGFFKLFMSLQVKNASNSADHLMRFWLRKNGTDVTGSATVITPLKLQEQVVSMHWLVESDGDDYWEIMYYVNDTNVSFPNYAAITSPVTAPQAPPIIVNVIPVGA